MKGYELSDLDFDEKRRYRRYPRAQEVQFQFKDPMKYGGSLSADLSEGGIRLHMSDFVPLGAEMTLMIRLTGDQVVECPCRVSWVVKNRFSDRYQAGLEFVASDSLSDSQRQIHGFLSPQA